MAQLIDLVQLRQQLQTLVLFVQEPVPQPRQN